MATTSTDPNDRLADGEDQTVKLLDSLLSPQVVSALQLLEESVQLYEVEAGDHHHIGEQLDRHNDKMPDERELAIARLMERLQKSYTAAKESLGTDRIYSALRDERATLQAARERASYRMLAAERRIEIAKLRALAVVQSSNVKAVSTSTAALVQTADSLRQLQRQTEGS